MKVVIINKSDSTGGAAVVSMRLMEALRSEGVDCRMVVAEKLTDSPYVGLAAGKGRIRISFLLERLRIFIANGFDRSTLFKIDTGSDGVDLWNHPWVRQADVICLNWINQGLLSLKGIGKLGSYGKPLVWTMHDMWNMTGVCHHAGSCDRYVGLCCGLCPLLGHRGSDGDVSRVTWLAKKRLYGSTRIAFVAVSNWLASLARGSDLMGCCDLSVIPNAFPVSGQESVATCVRDKGIKGKTDRVRIVFGAARLDDSVKGFPILIEATRALKKYWPEKAGSMELVMFGSIRDRSLLDSIAIPVRYLGMVHGAENIGGIYDMADIVVSTSLYETLPGTLIEGQAAGCVPVSFSRGGQSDIIDHLSTGYLADWSDDPEVAGRAIAEGIVWASEQDGVIRRRMYDSVVERFSAPMVARRYISLFRRLLGQ